MTVDWFLVDAPHVAPDEFAAWEAAKKCHMHLFLCLTRANERSDEWIALELAAREAQAECDRLENVARTVWACRRGKDSGGGE